MNFKPKKPSRILGIALEGTGISGAVVQRVGERLVLRKSFSATLLLDPLTSEPELVAREIQNHLERAGIREKRCVVCVPMKWALCAQAEVPDISEEDAAGFLEVVAEREFPFAPNELMTAVSQYQLAGREKYATLVAIPMSHIESVRRILKRGHLHPHSITLGISALLGKGGMTTFAALLASDNGIDFAVGTAGGVVTVRSLEAKSESEGFDMATVARQVRISIGQLPSILRDRLDTVHVFGGRDITQHVMEELPAHLDALGLEVVSGTLAAGSGIEVEGAEASKEIAAVAVAAEAITSGRGASLEFLPPRSNWLKQTANRFSARAALYLMAAAAVVFISVVSAFSIQYWRLSTLDSDWQEIEARVTELEGIQGSIRQFRWWTDDIVHSLELTKALTSTFPADGALWAKLLSVKNGLKDVSCVSSARDNEAILDMLGRLRGAPGVSGLSVGQVQGEDLLRFNFNYRWTGAAQRGR